MTLLPKKSQLILNIQRSVDARGSILSIVDNKVLNVSIIESDKNTIRSNHYHIKDYHFMYVLEGEVDYSFKSLYSDEVNYLKILKGQTIFTPNKEIHATYFAKKTKLIVSSGLPRDQKTYENDTRRVEFLNDKNLDTFFKNYAM